MSSSAAVSEMKHAWGQARRAPFVAHCYRCELYRRFKFGVYEYRRPAGEWFSGREPGCE